MRKVYRLIRQLGVTSKYKGYYYVAEAVKMFMEIQDHPIKITKDIYPSLAKQFKSTPVNVEHDIRTVINVCWESNKEAMNEIAGYPLRYKPTNSEFIDMMAYYLMQTEIETSYPDRKLYTDYSIVKSIRCFLKKFSTALSHAVSKVLSNVKIREKMPVVQSNSLFLY